MSKISKHHKQSKASRFVGPEDVQPGDYVTISHTTHEVIACDAPVIGGQEMTPMRVRTMSLMAGWPFKIVSVSLPFVMVIDADGDHATLDFRRHQLARLAKSYGKAAFKSVRAAEKRRSE
jgi:hypothetical protein